MTSRQTPSWQPTHGGTPDSPGAPTLPSLGLVLFPAFDWAITPTHPEREERLLYTRDQIVEEGLLDLPALREYRPGVADRADLERVHVGVPDVMGLVTDAHRISAGGAITAARAVVRGEVPRAFALVRPPGHHAMRIVHGTRGFCTVNIEAVMIEHLRRHHGVRRVAIVDTDVHHGDGTQDIYYHDPDTLFISLHQDGRTLYPGSGFPDEAGGPTAHLSTINVPLPPGTGDEGYLRVMEELVLPVLDEFAPDLVVNSAGQDNHYTDPLAHMALTAQGYARLTRLLGADVAVLEGGYSIEAALPYVNVAIILAMAGLDFSGVVEPDGGPRRRRAGADPIHITRLVSAWRERWDLRDELREQAMREAGDWWRRRRRVFYDDSDILEEQDERLRVCRDCPGWHGVSSRALGEAIGEQSAYAVTIPLGACGRCAREARDAARARKREGAHDHCFIQDRPQDVLERL